MDSLGHKKIFKADLSNDPNVGRGLIAPAKIREGRI